MLFNLGVGDYRKKIFGRGMKLKYHGWEIMD